MQIQNSGYQPNFSARFFHSESLKQIAEYAVEHGKFDKLNAARKNINNHFPNLRKRIFVSIGTGENNNPFLELTCYKPKRYVIIPQSIEDYRVVNKITFQSNKKINPLKYALEKLLQLGRNVPNNKIYNTLMN